MSISSHQKTVETSINPPPRTRIIHKFNKKGGKMAKKRSGDGFTAHLHEKIAKGNAAVFESIGPETSEYWLQQANPWFLCEAKLTQMCMEKQLNELPLLASIQQLFSLSSGKKLASDADPSCFYRYCRVVSFVDNTHANILLKSDQASGVAHLAIDRQGSALLSSILLLSSEELQALQKRGSFMEKLRENESKYDTSITRMSDISKQLAFNYRVYLEKRNQLTEMLSSISAKIPQQPEYSYQNPKEEYARLLLKKNLTNAFGRINVDPLNYFKFKEHCEAGRVESYRHVRSADELKSFIEKRKPKRGRKLQLATACSVCLSDYHELSNPFQSCSVCGLRAHVMCFSFEHSRCGYCSYQKVERHVKEESSWCFICRQPGLMTIRLHGNEFAHAFCLLIHGFWRVGRAEATQEDEQSYQQGVGCNSSASLLQTRFRKTCTQIEFLNPKLNCTNSSLPAIDSTIYASNPIHPEQIEIESSSSLRDIGVIREREEIEMWENSQDFKKTVCACCQQGVYGACYLSCSTCRQVYHGLCAFFSGFDLKMSEHAWQTGAENAITLNCCAQACNEVAWSRKYRLNYQRMAFNLQGTSLQLLEQSIHDKDALLFPY